MIINALTGKQLFVISLFHNSLFRQYQNPVRITNCFSALGGEKMFEAGELIMCGGHGVCRVTAVTGNPIDKLDKKRKYYILEPVFEKGSTIYTPVDNEKIVMRKIMDEKAAKLLIGRIPDIETVWIKEEKTREQMYKEAIRTYKKLKM